MNAAETLADQGSWRALYQEVRKFKLALPSDAQIRGRGFSILFSPPRVGQLLVLGLNPSRSDSSYAEKHPDSELSPPRQHLYLGERGGDLAKELFSMLGDAKEENPSMSDTAAWQAITDGSKINMFFFGSRNWTEWCSEGFWGSRGHALRKEVEFQCKVWVCQIITTLTPSKILCEGLTSFDQLRNLYGGNRNHDATVTRPGRGKQRLFTRAHLESNGTMIPVLGILHPTGGRGKTKAESRMLGEAIINFCSES